MKEILQMGDILCAADVCKLLGVSPATLSRITNGKMRGVTALACIPIGRCVRYRYQVVQYWIVENEKCAVPSNQ